VTNKSPTACCPQCGRVIPVHKNRFGDLVYNHHKMATISNNRVDDPMDKLVSSEQDWKPNINKAAAPIWEIDCPMSGQPTEA
jgi:hypothetical protein